MSMTKRWLEDISVEIGHEGAITEEVIAEGTRRLGKKLGLNEDENDDGES